MTADQLLERARRSLDRLDPAAAWVAAQEGSILLVDTRSNDARARTGIIPGSVHAPLSVLYWRADRSSPHKDPRIADDERRLVLLCTDGYSSSIAAATLQELGHADATDVDGGVTAWERAGLPLEPGLADADPLGGPLDGVVAAPEHHRVIYENERVRMLETSIPAGATTKLHTHLLPTVMYVVSGSHFVRRDASGEVMLDTRAVDPPYEMPRTLWAPSTPEHTLENTGEDDLVVIGIELKN
jgi:rhodanese-related sulfurtransferase/mannose-6-phosphate isomerase-like protein (cupin superfamily)